VKNALTRHFNIVEYITQYILVIKENLSRYILFNINLHEYWNKYKYEINKDNTIYKWRNHVVKHVIYKMKDNNFQEKVLGMFWSRFKQ